MKVTMKLPREGMNMEEATICRWHKKPGEAFARGDLLYEYETEKATQEVEATADGRLLEILVPEGGNATVGQVLCVLDVQVDVPRPA